MFVLLLFVKGVEMSQVLYGILIVGAYTVALLFYSPSSTISPGFQSRPSNDPENQLNPLTQSRRDFVVEMTKHAWKGYMKFAAGADELLPVSNSRSDRWGHIGTTPIDSLDTLLLMNLREEFDEGQRVMRSIDIRKCTRSVSVFEMIIRHLGGSLSAYLASNDTFFLSLGKDVADGLLHAFDTPLGFAAHQTRIWGTKSDNEGSGYMLAEIGSNQLEMRYLSHLLGDPRYAQVSERLNTFLQGLDKKGWPSSRELYDDDAPTMPHKGLFPTFISMEGRFSGAAGWASRTDSFYEYLLKQWILFGKRDVELLEMYEDAVEGLLQYLLKYTSDKHYAVLGYFSYGFHATMDHLVCFAPGTLILGVMHGAHSYSGRRERSFSSDDVVNVAIDIAATCYRMYAESPAKLSPDAYEFVLRQNSESNSSDDVVTNIVYRNPKYILRPEVVESLFYLYRYTNDERYRDWGWEIAQAIEKETKTMSGFSALKNVSIMSDEGKADSMESFFIAETLKYLYLLFSDSTVLPLDEWVLTTEAHPLRIVHP